jgi:aspartyl aminopeptidase
MCTHWHFYQVVVVDKTSSDNFKFNTETEFTPILGLLASNLNAPTDKVQGNDHNKPAGIQDNHHPALLALLAEEMNVKAEEIYDFELYVSASVTTATSTLNSSSRHLYDTQPSGLGGLQNEFIFSPRMDNLFSS